MIFFNGESSSLHGIYDDFASWSSLNMNREKTELFFAGLNQTESAALASYGFATGSFPILYLGLPLMHRKLKVSEYEPLLDSITRKFRGGQRSHCHMQGGSFLFLHFFVILGVMKIRVSARKFCSCSE